MHRLLRILFVLAVTSPLIVNANTHADEGHGGGPETELTPEKQREKNNEFVKHHTKDSHDFGVLVDESEDKHYGFPLPVILYDNGIHFFWSSAFEHGHKVVESNGLYYKLDAHDGKIYKTDEHGHVLKKVVIDEDTKEESLEELMPLDLSITKNVFIIFLMSLEATEKDPSARTSLQSLLKRDILLDCSLLLTLLTLQSASEPTENVSRWKM